MIAEITGQPYGATRECRAQCGRTIQAGSRTLIDLPSSKKPGRKICQQCTGQQTSAKESSAQRVLLTVRAEEELHTILAALRFYQAHGQSEPKNRSDGINDLATNAGELRALGGADIDALCERLNFSE